MEFEWDDAKAEANDRKHGIPFSEAMTVFADPLALTGYDPDHSDYEDRYITMGLSATGRLLVLSHTDRGERVRIISAREATRSERKDYEDGNFP
ncbi:MAG TPA: BrnT family toxin [Fimbriiglobus sp.]|nr:BrnT family toxin [Fimbriiglobus sp.]